MSATKIGKYYITKNNPREILRISANYQNILYELEEWLNSEIKRLENIQNPKKGIKPYGQEYDNYTLLIGAYDNMLDKIQEIKEKYDVATKD